jgi:hypothetical protein
MVKAYPQLLILDLFGEATNMGIKQVANANDRYDHDELLYGLTSRNGKKKHCKGSVILVNDEHSVTLSDKAERPEKKRQSAPGFAVERAVIKSWRVFFWSNQPQKASTCFIIRFLSGPLPGLASAWRGRNPRLTFKFNHP